MYDDKRLMLSAVRWPIAGFATYALIGAVVTLVGWFAGIPRLTDWLASGISMFPNAALAALCSGTALLLSLMPSRWPARVAGLLGLFVAILGSATLFQHFSGINLGIDTVLIYPPWGTKAAMAPGRMGPPASISFTLLGIALVLIASRRPRARKIVPALGITVSLIATLSLMGYISGADPLFAVARYTGIAMQTASILLALALAVVASAPEREPVRTLLQNSAAGLLARRSLPFIVGLPIVLGWLRIQGQNARLFDTAMGTSLLVLLLIVIFCGLLWWCVGAVARFERALRHRSEQLERLISDQVEARKLVEESRDALRASEERRRLILDTALDAVITIDSQGTITGWNPQASVIFGWQPTDALGKRLSDLIIPPQYRAAHEHGLRRYLEAGVGPVLNRRIELTALHCDGREFPVELAITPLVIEGQHFFSAFLRDITERRRTEEALRQSQKRFHGIIFSAMDAVITIDSRQRIVLFNPAAEAMFGLSASDAMGKHIEHLIPGRFRSSHGKFVEAFGHTGVSNRKMGSLGAISGLRTNGEEFPIEASISQIEIGGEKLFTVILRDITERKKAEEHQGQLAAIVADSEDAIVSKTLDGIVTSWNPGAEALFGYSAAEMIGRSIRQTIPPEAAAEEDLILMRLRAGQSVGRETVRLKKNGERVPVSMTSSPIKDAAGHIIGGAEIARDITGQKEAEDKLRDAQRRLLLHAADLEATVAERTAKLRETVNELQSFSYSIAHDMRAPLRAMGTFAQLLRNEMPASTPPETRAYCERIMVGASRLDNLINDALNYTKSMLQEFPAQPVDLSRLVHGLVDTYPNLHAGNADIHVEGSLPVVLGNESLLTQCFSNLLGNAVKFVAPRVRPKVRVWSESKDGFARIWVEDNGIGIPVHAQPRLFAMFQKLDNQYEGTGIGLAIVRKSVERMGGKVGVESEPGRGSRFWVDLRMAPIKETT